MQTFKTGPTPDQLREMDRDIQFYPSTTKSPSALTLEQIESFNTDGIGESTRDENLTQSSKRVRGGVQVDGEGREGHLHFSPWRVPPLRWKLE